MAGVVPAISFRRVLIPPVFGEGAANEVSGAWGLYLHHPTRLATLATLPLSGEG
jgi:hypothetical protein